MKHKKLKILALPLAIASASAIGMVSGTLAYFTSMDKATVTIEAGQVKVSLAASDLKVYSLDVQQTATGTVDSKTVTYFENGGYALMEGNVITLDRITPGDKVTFDVKFKNESNVDIKYAVYPQFIEDETGVGRTDAGKVIPHAGDTVTGTGKLSAGLTFNIENDASIQYNGVFIPASVGSADVTHHLSLELPAAAGNEYQGAKAKIILTAYAEQQNSPSTGVAYNWFSLKSQAASSAGSAVYVLGDVTKPAGESLTVTNGLVIDGSLCSPKPVITCDSAQGYAHSFIVEGGDLTFKNVTVEDKSVDHFSTVRITDEDVTLTLENTEFISDRAHGKGGYVFATSTATSVKKVSMKNCVIDGYASAFYGYYIDGVEEYDIDNCVIDVAGGYVLNIDSGNPKIDVRNSTLRGWTSYGSSITSEVKFTNCNFMKSQNSGVYYILRAYAQTHLKECKFYDDFPVEFVNGAVGKLTDCKHVDTSTSAEVTLTAANVTDYNVSIKHSQQGLFYGSALYCGSSGSESLVQERIVGEKYVRDSWPTVAQFNEWLSFANDSFVMPSTLTDAAAYANSIYMNVSIGKEGSDRFDVYYDENALADASKNAQAIATEYKAALVAAGFTLTSEENVYASPNSEYTIEVGYNNGQCRMGLWINY